MIPKIIHQTWKTQTLPERVKRWHEKIIKLHPDWEIHLWTDEDNLKLISDHFPKLIDIYCNLQYNIMRADLIRYAYMFIFGGYYIDLDYELFVPFDQEYDADLILPLSQNVDKKPIIGNSIFGSIPNHVFWSDILERVYTDPPLKKFYNKFDVLKLTGPDFITSAYFSDPSRYNGLLLDKNIFHPNHQLAKKKNYENILKETGSKGIHHCHGSWLKENNSIVNHIYRGTASFSRRLTDLIKKS